MERSAPVLAPVLALVLTLAAAGPALAGCPANPDLKSRIDPLMTRLRESASEGEAEGIMNRLWKLWTIAPDAKAQSLLDQGMQRRDEYDLASAWDDFDQLVTYCPDYAEGYNQRAFVDYLLKHYKAALADLDKALALNPGHVAALAGKALTEIGMGDEKAGQATLRQALKLNPWLPERRFLKGPVPTSL